MPTHIGWVGGNASGERGCQPVLDKGLRRADGGAHLGRGAGKGAGAGDGCGMKASGDAQPVAPQCLGLIERHVCLYHGVGQRAVRIDHGNADAHRQCDIRAPVRPDGRCSDGGADRLGDLCHFQPADTDKGDAEFLSAQTPENAASGQRFADGVREVHQCCVATGMAVLIVDLLEPVQIKQHERRLLAGSHGRRKHPLECRHEGAA